MSEITTTERKFWKLGPISFAPIFEVIMEADGITRKDVECKQVQIRFQDPETGKEHDVLIDFINLFQFVYFVANEELRRQLLLRHERKINYIPYEVTFKLDPEEVKAGMAKRRIELPVDEISVAMARAEANRILQKQLLKKGKIK